MRRRATFAQALLLDDAVASVAAASRLADDLLAAHRTFVLAAFAEGKRGEGQKGARGKG